ncbi:GntR family transcriptional regulator [Leifsonia sp. 2MCAF36]|uniref:GntR family transcriptional regulator n=1 Tax=Leifsonia sp. 2MCAF36 TaxID=3232988 RepID=UPI003F953CED
MTVPIPDPIDGPTPRRLIRDRAYDAIREAILSGELRPGERLDDTELQNWLGISRTPIRQALYALTLEGFIETAPQAHTRVVRPRPEDAAHYLQTIGVLVAGVTVITMREATGEQRERLIERLRPATAAIGRGERNAFIERVSEYYIALVAMCPNPMLTRLVEQTATALGYSVVVAFEDLQIDWDDVREQYELLIQELDSGTPETIEDATRQLFRLPSTSRHPA